MIYAIRTVALICTILVVVIIVLEVWIHLPPPPEPVELTADEIAWEREMAKR